MLEISVIRDYKKVYEFETSKYPVEYTASGRKVYCLPAATMTKAFDFSLLGSGGWTLFGINPAIIWTLLGIITVITLAGVYAANNYDMDKLIETDGPSLLFTVIAILMMIIILAADFHIFI